LTSATLFPPSLQTLEPVPQSSLPSGLNVPSLLARVTPVQPQLGQSPQLVQSSPRIVQLPTQPIPQNRMGQIQVPVFMILKILSPKKTYLSSNSPKKCVSNNQQQFCRV
jgi:hypothetical protein